MGAEHTHATTYFATRILYQRGKLDLAGVIARLRELMRKCPEFAEARAMLGAAERGSLRPDPLSFNQATIPPPSSGPDDDDDDDARPTQPGHIQVGSIPPLEAALSTPQAPGIPRAPPVPRFASREGVAPSYTPPAALDLVSLGGGPEAAPAGLETSGDLAPQNDTVSAPPPSSTRFPRARTPPALALDLVALRAPAAPAESERTTAPSPKLAAQAEEAPSVFVIATWLAERDFERALSAIERLGADTSPEVSLLEVRALAGLGRKAAARRSLERLCRAPLLDPDLRAAVARLLIELGDTDRAEAQARRAHVEDPASGLSRLTLAWAVVRGDAWLPSPRSAAELSQLLADFSPEGSPLPVLGYAISALMLLQTSAAAARQAAEAALALEPESQDALAVAAVIAQKQRRAADALRLHQRLFDLDPHAAQELAATLASLDLDVAAPPPDPSLATKSTPPAGNPQTQGASPWDDKEQRLAQGDSRAALFEFEQGLARRLEALPARTGAAELAQAALITARYLTEFAISRHFAPYDLSLFSIARLDVALGLIYRGGVGPRTELRARALLGLGAYAGESVRRAYAGEWAGAALDPLRMHVEGQGLHFSPFGSINARLQSAQSLELVSAPVQHPGAEPLGQRVALSVAPPAPWDPATWPDAAELPELGARLRESPVGLYCAGVEVPLDLSFASLRSLDRYVTLLAPPLAPSDPEAGWVRRAAVLVGAYLGEVLCRARGGNWDPLRGELRPEAYRITLPGGAKALPVAAAFERLAGRRLEQPSDYARRIST